VIAGKNAERDKKTVRIRRERERERGEKGERKQLRKSKRKGGKFPNWRSREPSASCKLKR
jgi:uncharacterized protein with von Willebrand factor type A (vWA) domain